MTTWLVPRQDLTPDQLRAVELSPSEHRVIFCAPGSGKTQILVHRARYLCDTWQVPANRFHIFVFNNVLKDYIKSGVRLLDLSADSISTLDYWPSEFYKSNVKSRRQWNDADKVPD